MDIPSEGPPARPKHLLSSIKAVHTDGPFQRGRTAKEMFHSESAGMGMARQVNLANLTTTTFDKFNSFAEKLTQIKLNGRTLKQIVDSTGMHGDDVPFFFDQMRLNLEGNGTFSWDQEINLQNKPKQIVRWRFVHDKKNNTLTSNISDITELKKESAIDQLTKLENKAASERALTKAVALFLRDDIPLTVIMGDIDHFKRINDTYGHATGDFVLREMANGLKNRLRTADETFREGGEEFLLLLSNTNMLGAEEGVHELRRAMGNVIKNLDVSMSFGISGLPLILPPHPDDPSSGPFQRDPYGEIPLLIESIPLEDLDRVDNPARYQAIYALKNDQQFQKRILKCLVFSDKKASKRRSKLEFEIEVEATVAILRKIADKGLYAAKQAGRNRVGIWPWKITQK